jgi:hypothetical protein
VTHLKKNPDTGKSYRKGRFSTNDLHVLTSLDQLHFILRILLPFYNTSYTDEEINCTEPSRPLVFPARTILSSCVAKIVKTKLKQEQRNFFSVSKKLFLSCVLCLKKSAKDKQNKNFGLKKMK